MVLHVETVPIIGKCGDSLLVDLGDWRVGRIRDPDPEGPGPRSYRLTKKPDLVEKLDYDPGGLAVLDCDSSHCLNFGPLGYPADSSNLLSQFGLSRPYGYGHDRKGYYCMHCVLPPR